MTATTIEKDLIPLAEVAKLMPSARPGRRVSLSSIHRWRTNGVRGVRLACVRVGHAWFSTRKAVEDFVAALSGDNDEPATASEPVATAAGLEAERALAGMGL